VGTLALAGVGASIGLIALGTAAAPSSVVPRSSASFFPAWLSGPLHAIAFRSSSSVLVALVLIACACYALALRFLPALGPRRLWAAIVIATLAGALAPPLFSSDLFGYIGYARLAGLHGLSPYTHGAGAAVADPISRLVGWPKLTTPYGPLFTLTSEALAPLSIAASVWILKAVAALTSLATVAVIWRLAPRLGRSPRAAAAFYGLNPLVLVFAVPGAHNEALIGVLVAVGALWMLSGAERRGAFALVAASAVKASAALALPFALIGAPRRRPPALALVAAIVLVAVLSLIAFGPSLSPLGAALATQQGLVAGHSLPSQVSKLLGLGELALGVRVAFLLFAAVAFVALLRRCLRGAPWLDCYGWSTLALLAATAWLWPWYGLWALLPASLSSSRWLRAATLLATAYLIAIRVAIHHPLSAG
jgi:alpha-1,6-mannosyltransferase